VQWYSLASQAGEAEADMALSKWFLCGAEGAFEKDEGLARTFAGKAGGKVRFEFYFFVFFLVILRNLRHWVDFATPRGFRYAQSPTSLSIFQSQLNGLR
jgi:hypothetical protein